MRKSSFFFFRISFFRIPKEQLSKERSIYAYIRTNEIFLSKRISKEQQTNFERTLFDQTTCSGSHNPNNGNCRDRSNDNRHNNRQYWTIYFFNSVGKFTKLNFVLFSQYGVRFCGCGSLEISLLPWWKTLRQKNLRQNFLWRTFYEL